MQQNIYKKYKTTLAYLFTQLPMFQRIGNQAFKKDLTNIKLLCDALDNPFEKYPTIHIAGTNGKGSTAHLLSAVFQEHGKKVGLYTSPHYKDFRERIKINGKYISRKKVVDFVEKNKKLLEKIRPSFFEITVAMAFDFFAKEKVDIAIIETGLGGRLDSTNVILPMVSVITNISFDHQQFLGNTLPKIAGEKAGIIKKKIPVVIGEYQKLTASVFKKKAKEEKSNITFANKKFRVELKKSNLTHTWFDIFQGKNLIYKNWKVNLHGDFQAKNLATVLETLQVLNTTFSFQKSKIQSAFENLKSLTNFKGRWQILQKNPLVLCDSAHNEAGLKQAMQQLEKIKYKKLHCVLGMVKDKDIAKMLQFFPPDAQYYFSKPDIPRGLPAEDLQAVANQISRQGKSYASVKNALRAAKRAAQKNDLIYVGGSTFVVAEIIP